MKKYKFISLLALLVIFLSSCERDEVGLIIDQSAGNAPLVSLEDSSVNLAVLEGNGTATASAIVSVSSSSNQDRSFNVNVNTVASTAPTDIYTVPATVTIPANSFVGMLTVTGIETPNLTTAAQTVVVELAEDANLAFTNTTVTFNIFRVCPIPSDYLVGEYDLFVTQSAGAFGAPIFRGPAGGASTVVTLEVGATETERTYRAIPRGTTASNARTFTLSLVCGRINLSGNVADPVNPPLLYGPGTTAASYDLSDDSVQQINFTGNVNSAFGGSATQGQFILQKR